MCRKSELTKLLMLSMTSKTSTKIAKYQKPVETSLHTKSLSSKDIIRAVVVN